MAALALGLARAATEVVSECDVRLREHLRALPAPAEHVDVLAELLGEDLESWPSDAWLVLDDYQEIAATEDAEKFVEELVAASSIQLLIASRQRPSWISARRILYGEVLELNQTELAMDGHEAAEVLTERNAASASGLVALANGWPAVIGLASVSAAEIDDGDSVPESLYQFFAEEVFSALDVDVQEGLATLAIAPVIDRNLAGRLLGNEADRICSAALDVGILVERGTRLEIHPLARAFLEEPRDQVALVASSDSVDLCLEYFRERRDWDTAFDLAARRGQPGQVELLLEDALDELLETARLSTIERWCEHGNVRASEAPVFALGRAELALRRGRVAEAQAWAAAITHKPGAFRFRALCIAGRAAHVTGREEEALELFRRAQSAASSEAEQREARWGQLMCMIDLEVPETISAVEEMAVDVPDSDPREAVRAASLRLVSQTRFGEMKLADADRTAQLLAAVDDPLVASSFLSVYSSSLACAARYPEARTAAASLLAMSKRYRLDFAVPYALCAAGIAEAGLRNWDEAERTLNEGVAEARASGVVQGEQNCLAALLRTLAQHGRYEIALVAANEHSLRRAAPVPAMMRAELDASRAFVLAAMDRTNEAIRVADTIRGTSSSVEPTALLAAVDAVVSVKRHDVDAIDKVNEFSQTAFASGALDTLVLAYRSAPELLAILLHTAPTSERVRELVRCIGDDDLAHALGHSAGHEVDRTALLTTREREVFELLREGLTNREIARLLVITEGTAKLHVQHVFDKLGVRSRKTIAMQAALERGAQATSAIGGTTAGADSQVL